MAGKFMFDLVGLLRYQVSGIEYYESVGFAFGEKNSVTKNTIC